MTAITTTTPAAVLAADAPRFSDVLRSEWVKLSSMRSTWFALVGMLVLGFGGGFATAFRPFMSSVHPEPDIARTMYDLTMVAGALCPVFVGILGVLCMGNEYASGTIQPTLLATPHRGRVLGAKALLVFLLTVVTSAVMIFGAWAASYPLFAQFGYEAPITAPGVLGSLLGVVGYLSMVSVFGVGIGAIFRSNTAGAIIIFSLTFLGPALATLLPAGLLSTLARTLIIGNGGYSMVEIAPEGAPFANLNGFLSPLAGTLLVLAWTLLSLGIGRYLLGKRDA